ncbi:hypothetical protein GGR57DRAFT_505919 [Xylariaceae sp. FL1272]|nr:hypothetical protein GGR57DRAFT_505919 [Xylariaceae sp. FL1272]
MPRSIGHCDIFTPKEDHQDQLLREWVSLAIADDTFMTVGILLNTCRHFLRDRSGDPLYTAAALRHKQMSLCSLRADVESKPSAGSVAKALALAIDELNAGQCGVDREHLQGILAMVQVAGGSKTVGLTGLLEMIFVTECDAKKYNFHIGPSQR